MNLTTDSSQKPQQVERQVIDCGAHRGQFATREISMWTLYRVGAPLSAALGRCPVAVAGTRRPEGRRLAREVGRGLAEMGYTVVAGLARGVDEEAAFCALETGGRVVAVLTSWSTTAGLAGARRGSCALWCLTIRWHL